LREGENFAKNIVFLHLKMLIFIKVMTGEKKSVEKNTPKSKQETNNCNGSHCEAAANTKDTPSSKGEVGAGVAIGFGAAGAAAGTVSAAGVAGYAVGASQPFQEMAREVASDLGFGHTEEAIQPEVLQEPLQENYSEVTIKVEDNLSENLVVATEDELNAVVLDGELVENLDENEEVVIEEEIPTEEVIVEDAPVFEVEEELAEPICDTMDDAMAEDLSIDPLASNFMDSNIPIDNNMDMSDFI
jgi:hypothetical protein